MNEPDTDEAALKAFARRYRVRVRLDERGDPIIPGRRGQSQLYLGNAEDGELCLMVVDGPYILCSRCKELEGRRLWLPMCTP